MLPSKPACSLETYVKLLRAHRAIVSRVEAGLPKCGMTLMQLAVLEAILHCGPMTQRALGQKVLTSPGNLTAVIDRLEAEGLVQRDPRPGDRRAVEVTLTPLGRERISAVFPHHAADIAAAMAGLSPAELTQLSGLLRKLGLAAAKA
jgi:MarR family 2-MHQ and catechol resistance regulon transcriptional repressor